MSRVFWEQTAKNETFRQIIKSLDSSQYFKKIYRNIVFFVIICKFFKSVKKKVFSEKAKTLPRQLSRQGFLLKNNIKSVKRPRGSSLHSVFLRIRFRQLSLLKRANRRNPCPKKFRRERCRCVSRLFRRS